MDELPIGRRVAYWRHRRKMSQQIFADRLCKSKSWVDKIERGVRKLDKFSVVRQIAEVLELDVQILLGRDPQRQPDSVNCVDQVEIEDIQNALERYYQITVFLGPPPGDPPALPELRKAVSHAWLDFQHAKYGILARTLPRLLHTVQAAEAASTRSTQAAEASHLLGQAYQITALTLHKIGEPKLSRLAADRSIAISEQAADELLAGTATARVALALLALGRARPALEITINIASRLDPDNDNNHAPERISVYGQLLLHAALAAARIGDPATTQDLITAATAAADNIDGDANYYWTSFGPTNVQLYAAVAAVELGDGQHSIDIHHQLDTDRFQALTPERRANHYLNQARAQLLIGNPEQAGEMLVNADREAFAEVRCRPLAREVLSNILRRTNGTPPGTVAALAAQMNVGV